MAYSRLIPALLLSCSLPSLGRDITMISDFETEGDITGNDLHGAWTFNSDMWQGGNSVVAGVSQVPYPMKYDEPHLGLGFGGSAHSAKMEFSLGSDRIEEGNAAPWVNLHLTLGSNGLPLDLSGATHITFWTKSDVPMDLVFMVGTADVEDFCLYRITVPVTNAWEEHVIELAPSENFAQPSWGKQVPFMLNQANSLEFYVERELNNADLAGGTLYLDNIMVRDWDPVSVRKARAARLPMLRGSGRGLEYVLPAGMGAGRAGLFTVAGRNLGWTSFRAGQGKVALPSSRAQGPLFLQVQAR